MSSTSILDLHDISTLLSYEAASTEPRFRHTKLHEQCSPDGTFTTVAFPTETPIWGWNEAHRSKRGFIFKTVDPPVSRKDERDLPSNMLPANPTSASIMSLNAKELEQIYWEVRAHDGCYTAITLFQHFFDLFPLDKKLRVRTASGINFETIAFRRSILEFTMLNPREVTLSAIMPKNMTYVTGSDQSSRHAVLSFPQPGSGSADVVVDLASMQFGSRGRGSGGETFRLETIDKWMDFTSTVCEDMQEYKIGSARITPHTWGDSWLQECAQRVKARLEAWETDHWCGYCGAPGAEKRCPCHDAWYCSQDHQKSAWKFHKRFCATKN